jgi:bacteriorhodopsin
MTNRLNGWHRLWIVICVPLLIFAVLTVRENWRLPPQERLELFAVFGLLPCLLLFALGWAVAWIIRGFKGHGQ